MLIWFSLWNPDTKFVVHLARYCAITVSIYSLVDNSTWLICSNIYWFKLNWSCIRIWLYMNFLGPIIFIKYLVYLLRLHIEWYAYNIGHIQRYVIILFALGNIKSRVQHEMHMTISILGFGLSTFKIIVPQRKNMFTHPLTRGMNYM